MSKYYDSQGNIKYTLGESDSEHPKAQQAYYYQQQQARQQQQQAETRRSAEAMFAQSQQTNQYSYSSNGGVSSAHRGSPSGGYSGGASGSGHPLRSLILLALAGFAAYHFLVPNRVARQPAPMQRSGYHYPGEGIDLSKVRRPCNLVASAATRDIPFCGSASARIPSAEYLRATTTPPYLNGGPEWRGAH